MTCGHPRRDHRRIDAHDTSAWDRREEWGRQLARQLAEIAGQRFHAHLQRQLAGRVQASDGDAGTDGDGASRPPRRQWHGAEPGPQPAGGWPDDRWPGRRHHRRGRSDVSFGFGPGRPMPWWRVPRQGGRLRRASEGRLLGGVAEGISRRVGVDVTIVRLVFVLTCLPGFGLALYPLAWLLLPSDAEADETTAPGEHPGASIASRAVRDRRGLALSASLLPVLIALLLLASAFQANWISNYAWAVAVGLGCLVLIWRNAPSAERLSLERAARPVLAVGDPSRSLTQILIWAVVGAGAVAGGLALLFEHRTRAILWPIGGMLLVLAGVVVIFGPWWLRVARDLVVERQARARAEERADLAARVHDSVLQTLALIQRRSDDPAQVTALARAQERELRSWLFEGRPPGSLDEEATLFSEGLAAIQRDVEAAHGITVEAVVVGDCALDDDVAALLGAAREATVNAAKWSGASTVSIFAEAGEAAVSVFVRDRGAGFDPEVVPSDRKGVAQSIRGRMARAGGTATVRSAPGEGTEVVLELPRSPEARRERHGSAR